MNDIIQPIRDALLASVFSYLSPSILELCFAICVKMFDMPPPIPALLEECPQFESLYKKLSLSFLNQNGTIKSELSSTDKVEVPGPGLFSHLSRGVSRVFTCRLSCELHRRDYFERHSFNNHCNH